jgi:hypothetical protein
MWKGFGTGWSREVPSPFGSHGRRFHRGDPVDVRLDSKVELEYYRNGGILHTVLRKMALGRM